MLDFSGRVAIVTGSGGGLGKVYALALAACGCKVVVNDLGGSQKGDGASKVADVVVEEIKKKGGEAVANYDSVVDGDKVVETAIKAFGRVDIVINNAGILRDVSFHKMKDKDWDLLNLVHLKGAYKVTKAAWPYFRSQKFGRVIFVTSAAGLYGNFGQSHYSAVKMALIGLCNTLSIEGKKRNIVCNTIAPVAASRMTKGILPPALFDQLKPEFVSPLVEYLVHDSNKSSGGIYEVGAGWVAKVRLERSKGVMFNPSEMTGALVGEKFAEIADFTGAAHPTKINESFGPMMQTLQQKDKPKPKKNKHVDYDKVVGFEFKPSDYTYSSKDLMLYALGIGAGRNDRRFVYENDSDFQAIPSFGVIPGFNMMSALMSVPGLKFNPMLLLHGEQKLEVLKAIPTSGTLRNTGKISDIYDKGKKGAVILLDTESRDDKGDLVFRNRHTVFVRRIGDFGGDRGPSPPDFSPPKRAPDMVSEQKVTEDQAALYRLSGDRNPLHIDPQMASIGGFKQPILHGLCSFGFSVRAVLKHYCNNDSSKFKSVQVRFAKHVFPGETLIVEMWKVDGGVIFRTIVKERNVVSLKNCKVELHEKPSAATSPAKAVPKKKDESSFAAEMVFAQMAKRVTSDMTKKVGAVFRFNITKGEKTRSWVVDLKSKGSVTEVSDDTPADCTIGMTDSDFVKMITGKLNPQTAFMQGALKISGDMMLATKLSVLTKAQSAL